MKEDPGQFHQPWIDNPWMLEEAQRWSEGRAGDTMHDDVAINFFVSCCKRPDVALARLITLIHVADGDREALNQIVCGPAHTFITQCPEDFREVVRIVARRQPDLKRCLSIEWLV